MAHTETACLLPQFKFQRLLEHGQELELGKSPDGRPDWRLRVLHLPGHAPGHLAFQENRYGALLAGDLVSTLSSILIDPVEGCMREYLQSLRFLESVARGTLYPGHGPAARDGRAVVRKTIAHREEREQRLLGALDRQPRTLEELLLEVYSDVKGPALELAVLSLRAGLIKLQQEGRVVESAAGFHLAAS